MEKENQNKSENSKRSREETRGYRKRQNQSKVWNHFKLLKKENSVECVHCKNVLAYHYSTTSMLQHLNRKHQLYASGKCGPEISKSQRRMDSFMQAGPSCSVEQAAEFTDSILNMIVTDMHPLSMVEDEGFQKMISTFNPTYTLPPRTYFMKMIEKKYEDFKGGQKEIETERENSPTPPSAPVTFSQDTSCTGNHPADFSAALPVVLVTVTDTGLAGDMKDYMEEGEEPSHCGEKGKDGKRSEMGPEPQRRLHVSTCESSGQVSDATSEAAPIQSSIKEESTEAMYGDPATESLSVLVQYENKDADTCRHDAQSVLMTPETRAPQTAQASDVTQSSHTVQAPSSRPSTSCDLDTMDFDQLRREKIKMQIKVLKIQEEYYTQKIKDNKK